MKNSTTARSERVETTVLLEIESSVATITLNRPEHLNAMNTEMFQALLDVLTRAAEDKGIRAVVLTGTGRAFSAGGDLRGIAKGRVGGTSDADPIPERVFTLRQYVRSAELLRTMPKATVAQINGACAGAGLALACACDLRYCADSAVFNTAFLAAGLSGDFGGTWTLPRIIGSAKAYEFYLLGTRFDSQEAERLGLVTRRLPDEQLAHEVREVAIRLSNLAPLSLAALKANLLDSAESSFDEQLSRESDRQIRCAVTEDAREAASALLEKRRPSFHGR
jgi:2-(1,2-epoxy-1,2-dihydrophenyl)acetyl-CoA isomerase